jgi:hypothetical protein
MPTPAGSVTLPGTYFAPDRTNCPTCGGSPVQNENSEFIQIKFKITTAKH